jgi:hypothetical protein
LLRFPESHNPYIQEGNLKISDPLDNTEAHIIEYVYIGGNQLEFSSYKQKIIHGVIRGTVNARDIPHKPLYLNNF